MCDGNEKENLLSTIIYSTSKNYKADQVSFYIIDYGSESLSQYYKLPHLGGIVNSNEDEKLNNLFKLIRNELSKRKRLLIDYGGNYKEYVNKNNDKLPIFVVIINNYDSLYESNQNVYDEIPSLVRDSERYGIVFIMTGNSMNSIPSKISQNFHNIFLM